VQKARSRPLSKGTDPTKPLCPTAELMDFLGRRHMLHVIRMFGTRETLRFNEILKELKSSPNTLSLRLNELVESDILARQVFAEVPPRVDYSLTKQGRALLEGVMAFDEYLRRHAAPMAGR
jgi:DNA-binding HxlR family transcriptional regulator